MTATIHSIHARTSLLEAWSAGAQAARAGASVSTIPFRRPWPDSRDRLLALWWARGWQHGATHGSTPTRRSALH